jgi:hypothetical protein
MFQIPKFSCQIQIQSCVIENIETSTSYITKVQMKGNLVISREWA